MFIHKQRAFTLVELLVAIAIIALLFAILFPVVLEARKQSNKSVCASNLRQCGMALSLYLQDYGTYPKWIEYAFQPLAKTDKRILQCPQDPTGNWGGEVSLGSSSPEDKYHPTIPFSYVYIYQLVGQESQFLSRAIENEGSKLGILACQVHGEKTKGVQTSFVGIIKYEGAILRLQHDGAVVTRHTKWYHGPSRVGGMITRPNHTLELFTETAYEPINF